MINYLLTIQYDGSGYDGWQRQENTSHTIQEVMETTLGHLLGEDIVLYGSGRTDQGVHALGQTANFMSKGQLEEDFLYSFNEVLPADIKITNIKQVGTHFHSRLNAVSKCYSYHVCCADKPSVFQRKYQYILGKCPDVNKMQAAAELLIGTHDFRGFSSEKKQDKSCIRHIYDITIRQEKEELIITYHGSGFLYNMVRILTGTLLEIGIGERGMEQIKRGLQTGRREFAGATVSPNALFLESVFYDK